MGLQEQVDDWGEFENRALYLPTRNFRLIRLAYCDQGLAGSNAPIRFPSCHVLDATLLAILHNLQKLAKCIQAFRKAGVGIELNQNFLGLTDGQAGIQSLIQRDVELG